MGACGRMALPGALAWSFTCRSLDSSAGFRWLGDCAPAANSLIGDLFPFRRSARGRSHIHMLGLRWPAASVQQRRRGWHRLWMARTVYLAAIRGSLWPPYAVGDRSPFARSGKPNAIDPTTLGRRPCGRILAIPTVWGIIASGRPSFRGPTLMGKRSALC